MFVLEHGKITMRAPNDEARQSMSKSVRRVESVHGWEFILSILCCKSQLTESLLSRKGFAPLDLLTD